MEVILLLMTLKYNFLPSIYIEVPKKYFLLILQIGDELVSVRDTVRETNICGLQFDEAINMIKVLSKLVGYFFTD